MDQEPTRKQRISEAYGEAIQAQRDQMLNEQIDTLADAEPAFDTRSGESNFAKRIVAKIQREIRDSGY